MSANVTIAKLMEYEVTPENPDPWPPALRMKETSDPCTHAANAQRFAEYNGRDLIYIDGSGWSKYNGSYWVPAKFYADKCAQELGSQIREESIKNALKASDTSQRRSERDAAQKRAEDLLKWAKASEACSNITSTKKLAAAHLCVNPIDLDANSWLLNCSNGTLNLKTGELRKPLRADLITKSTHVPYLPDAPYKLWERVVLDICCGDVELMRYLQRVAGYCLTGQISEQVMFVFNGVGANGKDTFLFRLKKVMGDYAGLAAPGLLMLSKNGRHPTEVADLMGIRGAIASESDENGRLNEVVVKQLTGSERLKARKMRQDFYEFAVQFKLILMTNHRPIIEGGDYAIWRRIHLIPFNQVFKKGKNRDDTIPARLDAELPGILRWCVDGCLEWQKKGLQPPEIVKRATAQYKADQDVLSQFFDEVCSFQPNVQIPAQTFYTAYEHWCIANGERPKSQMWLWPKLQERGINKEKTRTGIVYRGLGILDTERS